MNIKNISLLILVVAGLVAGAYTMGINKGENKIAQPTATTPNQKAAKLQPDAVMGSNHPPLQPTQNNQVSLDKSGADANAKFTHFRVGNRNVKSIFAEDDKVWVGTSGGVIRYEPATDDYRLFDVRNGLLANGIFHVSRWTKNKMLIGTYGGGLAIYDEIKDKFEVFNVPEGLADAFRSEEHTSELQSH